jgi:hypothetical protein
VSLSKWAMWIYDGRFSWDVYIPKAPAPRIVAHPLQGQFEVGAGSHFNQDIFDRISITTKITRDRQPHCLGALTYFRGGSCNPAVIVNSFPLHKLLT